MKVRSMAMIAALALASGPTFADHSGGGGASNLSVASNNLRNVVMRSTLNYNVKRAVTSFDMEVDRYTQCTQYSFRGLDVTVMDHSGGGRDCDREYDRMERTWYPVDRYLYDTYYDYPYVYRAYQQVQRELQRL